MNPEARLKPIGTIKKLTTQYSGLSRALAVGAAYAIWISLFKLLCMTLVTYLVVSSSSPHGARFEEINDAYSSVEFLVLGAGALAFTFGFGKLYPSPSPPQDQLIRRSLPGLLQGLLISLGLALLFLFWGRYQYLGSLVSYDERPILALLGLLLKAASILALVISEERIFRGWIPDFLLRPAPGEKGPAPGDFQPPGPRIAPLPAPTRSGPASGLLCAPAGESRAVLPVILLSGALYSAVKFLEFDLDWRQGVTLILVSILLGLRSEIEGDNAAGTALWASLLVITHVGLGIPVFGNDSSGGVILLKYRAGGGIREGMRALTGGPGGLIGSLSLQILMLTEIFRVIFRESSFKLYIFKSMKRGS